MVLRSDEIYFNPTGQYADLVKGPVLVRPGASKE